MLTGRRCAECGTLFVDSGGGCPSCGARGGSGVPLSGRGRLISWTVIRVGPQRYAAEAPYAVAVLELEEGPKLTARLEGAFDELRAGQPIALALVDPEHGPVFRSA